MRFFSLLVTLFGFWLLNSGQLDSPFLLGTGLVCCASVAWIALRMGPIEDSGHPFLLCLRLPAYLAWLTWQVALSNVDVARRVLSPRLPIDPRLLRVPCRLRSSLGITVYANSIIMTPGTVTMSVDEGSMLIHALSAEAAEGLAQGDMEERVLRLERGIAAGVGGGS